MPIRQLSKFGRSRNSAPLEAGDVEDKETEFLQGLSSHPRIDVGYQTDHYVIYISPVNYVKLQ